MSKLAIITGGSGYLGSAIVDAFKKSGYSVASLSRANGVDVTDEVQVTKALQDIVGTHAHIHACVHAAAMPIERKPLLDIKPDSFDKELLVAAKGAYLLARAAKPYLVPDAAFVGITSEIIEPDEPVSGSGAYAVSKYALRGVLRSLAAELPRVYAVAPGFLPGGLNSDIPEAAREMLAKKYESPTPGEVAALVVELCEGSTIPTGSSVLIDRTYSAL